VLDVEARELVVVATAMRVSARRLPAGQVRRGLEGWATRLAVAADGPGLVGLAGGAVAAPAFDGLGGLEDVG
jgi:hypothetical protein